MTFGLSVQIKTKSTYKERVSLDMGHFFLITSLKIARFWSKTNMISWLYAYWGLILGTQMMTRSKKKFRLRYNEGKNLCNIRRHEWPQEISYQTEYTYLFIPKTMCNMQIRASPSFNSRPELIPICLYVHQDELFNEFKISSIFK